MIIAKLSFFWTSNSEGHGSHGNKDTIFFLGSLTVPMSQSRVQDILMKNILVQGLDFWVEFRDCFERELFSLLLWPYAEAVQSWRQLSLVSVTCT